jgi:hypothetical protein
MYKQSTSVPAPVTVAMLLVAAYVHVIADPSVFLINVTEYGLAAAYSELKVMVSPLDTVTSPQSTVS